MRILYHHRTASSDGQAVHIVEMVDALRALGHEVRIVAPAAADPSAMGSEVRWVSRLRRALPGAVYELLELAYSLVAFLRLLRVARAFRPDIIYERYNLFMLGGVAAAHMLRLPLLLEVNAPLASERARFSGLSLPRLAHWSERRSWQGAAHVLAVTGVLRDMIVAQGVAPARVTVIPNGVNEAHFLRAPSTSAAKARLGLTDRLVLGFTGFVRDWHGVDHVVRWMHDSAASSVHLLVVGDGPARAGLEALAAELGVAQRVTFTGVVERAEVPAYVAAFDVALQPAVVGYASPLKLFEYMALGKAIVAPRQPNVEEVLMNGSNALLFDVGDVRGLQAALERLVADAALRSALGAEAARTISRQGFSWRENARRVVALGERCAQHAPPAGKRYPWRSAD